LPFGHAQSVAPGIIATLYPSGHILGASMVLVEHPASGKRVLFSGDLGCPGRPLVPDPAMPPEADLVVVESTYGDRTHEAGETVTHQLADVINGATSRGGTVLIPCFAVERAQELLFHLQRLRLMNRIPKLPVFLDSPMAVKMLDVFRHHPEAMNAQSRGRMAMGDSPFAMPDLHLCSTRDESKRINELSRPAIVIAGSGMCNGGRIKHHLSRKLEDPSSALVFVGYQASGTLGRQLVDGAPEIRLFGELRRVRIHVAQIHGFSGHADQRQLLDWLAGVPGGPNNVAIVHGGTGVTETFAELVRARFAGKVTVPAYGDRVEA
jgi:metallo-beta-lactamase family protein